MAQNISVPDIGDFKDVEVIEVLVKPGDKVNKNDPIVTIESDKSSVEIPSPSDGEIKDLSGKKYFTFDRDYLDSLIKLNIDYNSDILINGYYYKFKNIKSNLQFVDESNPLDSNQLYSYFIFEEKRPIANDYLTKDLSNQNITISIPSKPKYEKNSNKHQITYSINNHLVSPGKKHVDFDFNKKNN